MNPRRVGASLTVMLPADLDDALASRLEEWSRGGMVRRLWSRDPTLWTGGDEGRWLGWLESAADESRQTALIREAEALGARVRAEGCERCVLVGMGGSSLCPEVLARTFGPMAGYPILDVLDTTDPGEIRVAAASFDPARSLVIVSSKSGTTLEPDVIRAFLFDRTRGVLGDGAGARFVAITDPGTALESLAATDGYRECFHGVPSIGGRYSALSAFGMIPAGVLGLDVRGLLRAARRMAAGSAADVPIESNEAVVAGCTLGVAGLHGKDKVTLLCSPRLRSIGAWLEQLIAESTGKQGKGLFPIDAEPVGSPDRYGDDRLFVYIRHVADVDREQDEAVAALGAADHPVMRIEVDGLHSLGGEFLRWEIATAVAGSLLGINPFDQPDVEASKVAARRLTQSYETTGALPALDPIFEEQGVRLFAEERDRDAIRKTAGPGADLARMIAAHLGRLQAGDCFTLLAWCGRRDVVRTRLGAIRAAVRDGARVATSLGFGPRYLHSTGQIHKGGPDSGLFLMITCRDGADLPVPGRRATFGAIRAAQALGDSDVLASRGRRILRVDIGDDVERGLDVIERAIQGAYAAR